MQFMAIPIKFYNILKFCDTTFGQHSNTPKLFNFQINFDHNGFKWDEHKQGMYLGSFYWLHWLSQIPGGILATKFGTKTIFGLANFIPCALCFITPIVSYLNYPMLVSLRIISGVCTGNHELSTEPYI